jgi:hypothetical protein
MNSSGMGAWSTVLDEKANCPGSSFWKPIPPLLFRDERADCRSSKKHVREEQGIGMRIVHLADALSSAILGAQVM